MLGALDAILGQRSAHSLATGPVTVDPTHTHYGILSSPGEKCAARNDHLMPITWGKKKEKRKMQYTW